MEKVSMNYLLTLARMVVGSLVLLVVTPYINRVFMPESIGKIEYGQTIISYFAMLTSLGIPVYGMREIAKYATDIKERTRLILEIGIILLITTLLGYIGLIIATNKINVLKSNKTIIYILSFWILLNNVGFEWVYRGLEEQGYITKRNILIKFISIGILFLSVKTKNDLLKYVVIIVLMNGGGNIFNLIHLKKYVCFKNIKLSIKNMSKHILPILFTFISSIGATLSTQIDVLMLGNINKEYVAFYTLPVKINQLILTLILSFGSVLVPRISYYISTQNEEEYKKYMKRGIKYILLISLPISALLYILSDVIIMLLGGENFNASISVLKIFSIILVVLGINNYLGFQLLFSHGKEKEYTISMMISAVINITMNYFLIKIYFQNGAAISTFISEIMSLGLLLILSKNYLLKIEFFDKKNSYYFFAVIFSSFILLIGKIIFFNSNIGLLTTVICYFSVYTIILYIFKEELVTNSSNYLLYRIRNIKNKRIS